MYYVTCAIHDGCCSLYLLIIAMQHVATLHCVDHDHMIMRLHQGHRQHANVMTSVIKLNV